MSDTTIFFGIVGLFANLTAIALFLRELFRYRISSRPLKRFMKRFPDLKPEMIAFFNEHYVICHKNSKLMRAPLQRT
jgi:hypothetical protein